VPRCDSCRPLPQVALPQVKGRASYKARKPIPAPRTETRAEREWRLRLALDRDIDTHREQREQENADADRVVEEALRLRREWDQASG
jgi:hypothetical protein